MSHYVKLCHCYVKLFFLLVFLLCHITSIFFLLFSIIPGCDRPLYRSWQTHKLVPCTEKWLTSNWNGQQWTGQLTFSRQVNVSSQTDTIIRIIFSVLLIISQVCSGFSSRYPRSKLCRPTHNLNELKWYAKQIKQIESSYCWFKSSICAVYFLLFSLCD